MTTDTQGPGTSGVLMPLLVDQALRGVDKWKPEVGRELRRYIQRLMTGEAPSMMVRLFPSTLVFVAKAAVRGGTLTAGRNPTQKCRRCSSLALVLLVDLLPVAFYDTCQKHAQEGEVPPTRAPATTSVAASP